MKLALSTSGKKLSAPILKVCKAAGVMAIEVSDGQKAAADEIDFSNVKRLSEQFGVGLASFHLPFGPFDAIDISVSSLAESTVSYLCTPIDRGCDIGIQTFVIHPSGEPISDEDRPTRMACAKNSLSLLAEYAEKRDAVIAVENLPRTCLGKNSWEILELLSAHPALRACFDTNHLLSESIETFIGAVGARIITTHVSDYDRINERHWLPGEGVIDWLSLVDSLRSVGYDGYWLYEVGLCGSLWSIDRPRSLTPDDLAINFGQIMEGKPPTPFGTAKKDLPMFQPKK
ncbi:MAG: sugar phosphate isomerase/epimerase [Clostridia bacterium]|nr:sugar phosphate isomerase/epimerase [Clostridia bacterium]